MARHSLIALCCLLHDHTTKSPFSCAHSANSFTCALQISIASSFISRLMECSAKFRKLNRESRAYSLALAFPSADNCSSDDAISSSLALIELLTQMNGGGSFKASGRQQSLFMRPLSSASVVEIKGLYKSLVEMVSDQVSLRHRQFISTRNLRTTMRVASCLCLTRI
jgi:hypothetical protein